MLEICLGLVALIILSIPVLTVLLAAVCVVLWLLSLGLWLLEKAIGSTIPEDVKRWAEDGPDEEEMRLIEEEIAAENLNQNSLNVSMSGQP